MKKKPEKKRRNQSGARVADETLGEDQVHLRDILGIKPGVYLTIMYSLVLALVLFFILIFPGLVNPGSLVILNTIPEGAALRVDGVYMGSAPDKIFVRKGTHTLELTLPGFSPVELSRDIPGRLFASLIFPRHYPLEAELSSPDPEAVFIEAARDYAAWTFGGEPTESWQIPLSLSEGAYRIGATGDRAFINEIIEASARFAVTKAALRDLIRAKTIADNSGLSPSPLSLCRSSGDMLRFVSQTPGAAQWLENLLPGAASVIADSSRQERPAANDAETGNAPTAVDRPPINSLNLGGLLFSGINGGFLTRDYPYTPQYIPAFMICVSEVTRDSYDTFLRENPQWSPELRSELAAQKLATEDYLIDDKPTAVSDNTMYAVSWYAAQAYCQWLSGRLPPSMAGYEVRLPFESEWEYAVSSRANSAGTPQSPALSGSWWEWCADPYAPNDFIPARGGAILALGSPEQSLRGWLHSFDPDGYLLRGSLPAAYCSSFVSFRPVIAAKE